MKKIVVVMLSSLIFTLYLLLSGCGKNEVDTTQNTKEDEEESTEETVIKDHHTHVFGEWQVITAPTCQKEGLQNRVCSCGEKETQILEKSGKHQIVIDKAVDATCTITGLTEGAHCSVCKAVITKQTVVPKIAHHYDDGFCTKCNARQESIGLEYVEVPGGYAVCGIGNCRDEVINIPETYNGLDVVEIADNALYLREFFVKELIIPDTVKKVGYNAIQASRFITITLGKNTILQEHSIDANGGCEIINHSGKTIASNVIFPNGTFSAVVIHTGSSSILDTTSDGLVFLTSQGKHYLCNYVGEKADLILPDSYNGEKYIISDRCFFLSDNLSKVTLSAGVSAIGEAAFAASSLTAIDFGNCEIKTIPSFCFMECKSLSSVIIPDSITTIEPQAFYDSGLISATIGESVENIGVFAFTSCTNLTYRAKNCTSFSTIRGVTNLIIGNSVLTIPKDFMYSNEALTSIEFEENSKCTTIGASAFKKTKISSIVIPETVTIIDSQAFANCNNLKTIKIESETLRVSTNGVFYSCSVDEGIALTVGNKVTVLPKGLFINTNVTSITFESDSVCKIIDTSFGGMQMKNVILPASIEKINFDSFDLQTLTVDENNPNLEITDGCIIDLKNAKLLKVFATEYNIPATVKTVAKDAFYNSGVTAITIPETVEQLEQGCLSCNTVLSISLPFIGHSRAEKCSLLDLFGTEKRLEFAVMSYYVGTAHQVDYYYPKALQELSIASGELTCYLGCFNSLQTIKLGKNVTEIGKDILTQCKALTAVYFDGTEAELQNINGNGWIDDLPRRVSIITVTE